MTDFPKHFPLAELLKSDRATRLGIPNEPTLAAKGNLAALAWNVLQPLREAMGGPIKVTSGYRSPLLNSKTPGSSTTSQHSLGEAVDIVSLGGFTNAAMFEYIRKNLPFDQLIWEFGDRKNPQWVHVSWRSHKRRGMILRATKQGDKTVYTPWTP
jgi:zinc D-Ala-D-Ala carboxypeptidase